MDGNPILDHDGRLCASVCWPPVNRAITYRRILQVDQMGDVSDCGDVHHPDLYGVADDPVKRGGKDQKDCLLLDQFHRLLRR